MKPPAGKDDTVRQFTVRADDDGVRLDRWFKNHFPGLGFAQLQKLLRSGQVRVDGGRAKSDMRVEQGQVVRVPPLAVDRKGNGDHLTPRTMRSKDDGELLSQMLLHEDPKVFVFNKPSGLAVQGVPRNAHPARVINVSADSRTIEDSGTLQIASCDR